MQKQVRSLSLCGEWNVRAVKNELLSDHVAEWEVLDFKGSVPGSTINDLIRAGIAGEDVFWRDNAEGVQKYENYNWVYSKEFEFSGDTEGLNELVFERLDTYCDIYLNGEHIAFCDNGYIEHRFDVSGKLKSGKNTIEVYFYSPINYTLGKPELSGAFTTERLYNRRIQCTYGWDWTMRFVTTGIYGDCYIETPVTDVQIKDVYIYTKSVDEDGAAVGFDFDLTEKSGAGLLNFSIISPAGAIVRSYDRFCKEKFFRFSLDIAEPELWYPAGYGEQPMYTLLVSFKGEEIYSEKFGIRTVRVLRLPDTKDSENYKRAIELKETEFSKYYDQNEEFSGCILKVNGVKILCKGANWVPCSPFETEGMEEKITKILALSKSMGLNIIRVWGGGYIEKKHFYDECSRLGILVMQDFFMACGSYPEKEEWFIRQLNREAEYTVKFLRNQPCLAWWHGDNENAVCGADSFEDHTGRDSAYSGLAPSVWAYDPYREFFPSSPYGGTMNASNTVGTTHNTQYLSFFFDWIENGELSDYKEYLSEMNARFVSEEPTFGAASLASLRKMMTDEDIFGSDDAMWKYHTQGNPALKKHLMDYYVELAEKVLGKFKDGEDKLFKLQFIQCELVRLAIERTRREKWFSAGVVFWMLSDCWAAASGWSFIDFYCAPKPSFYAFKRTAAPMLGSVCKTKNGELKFIASNDALEKKQITYKFTKIKNGEISEQSVTISSMIHANESRELVCLQGLSEGEVLVADIMCDGRLSRTTYKHGALELTRTEDYDIEIGTDTVKVTAGRYIQCFALECGDNSAVLDDNYFTLLPNETKVIQLLSGSMGEVKPIAYSIQSLAVVISVTKAPT